MFWLYVHRFSLFFINLFVLTFAHDLKAFDDTILFKIDWPGKTEDDLLKSQVNVEPYMITTADNEKYECFIPEVREQDAITDEPYTGPNPIQFLYLLFNRNSCSYRLESYWTYELCHGRYVQQYHEERDGKKVKIQTYELGKFDSSQISKLSAQYDEYAKNPNRKSEIPVKKIDGINMPYVEMEMTDGTLCDLNNKPRSIRVLYVCFQHGKQEIYSIKETATCEYETVVLTPYLCGHPDYKPQDTGENKINCRPIDNAPKKPISILTMELDSWRLRFQKVMGEKPQKVYAIFHADKDGQDGQSQVRVEIHPVDSNGKHYNLDHSLNALSDRANNLIKSNSADGFLSGENCLNGGNGWWKYEFCYGRSVTQYHIESGKSKISMSLGVFDVLEHMDWIKANPHKKPKPVGLRKQISHFYNHGTICDKTGKPRQTEVKLKCVSNFVGSPSSVSLYLLEPKVCEYVLGVESPLICNFLEHADDTYGIITNKVFLNVDELKANVQVEDQDERIANGDE
ncbi:PREDICTED: endoplasmic reticulum lectin 1 [Ceratosolen solmsi marchali]|uniref:Endoplasmic reticulum lectin 1 n=1 Tax=Ceratosolen solmsi marchali TaxID=326594 RepID=A0AAJ7DYJ6_9HYME|nr:PREDICTED: endoplasmic reticulum lectin 1 [Ceratosolen solmsi marchali]